MSRVASCMVVAFGLFLSAAPVAAQIEIDQLVAEARIETAPVPARARDDWRPLRKVLVRDDGIVNVDYAALLPDAEVIPVSGLSDIRRHGAGADAIIGYCDTTIVEALPDVRWIQIFSAGVERCMAAERVASGEILLTNMQKMSSPVIAEHALAMAMSLARGMVQYGKAMPAGAWNRQPSTFRLVSLSGKTMLVVGLGGIGSETARRANAIGMRVLATRNSSRSGPDYVDYVGLADELHELAGKADVIVNALPLTPATTNVFDAEFFNAAKPGVIFINVARGKSVVTADLVAALEDGRVSAAGLDVTEPEPLPADHPLWQMENVVITPHISSRAGERERHAVLLAENIRRYQRGDALYNTVDPERGY